MTTALLFHPTAITAGHKNDAGYFRSNALLAAKIWTREQGLDCLVIPFDNTLPEPARRAFVQHEVMRHCDVSVVAFFCHGWTDGFQAGFTRGTISLLARALFACSKPGILFRVVLFCCSTGSDRFGKDGDNSVADDLRDECSVAGMTVQVDCHTTPGDATENPHVRRLESPAGKGGALLIEPGDPHEVQWDHMLTTSYRFRFSFRTRNQVKNDVLTG